MQTSIAKVMIISVSMVGLFAHSFSTFAVVFFIALSLVGIFFSARETESYFNHWHSKKYNQTVVFIPCAVIGSAVVLSDQAHSLYNHCSYGRMIILCLTSTFIFFLLHKLAIKDFTLQCLFPKRWKTFRLISLLWAFGAVTHINSHFGNRTSVLHRTRIIDIKLNSSDSSFYLLSLEPFGNLLRNPEIKVSKLFYNSLGNQEYFPIQVQKGCLGIEYYPAIYTK
ncbi:MAG TPA: hypothetical protein PK006_08320 [Saprospiraceae bacterium]|nr:hypothetical protein [Saprospiraceae bacterium]